MTKSKDLNDLSHEISHELIATIKPTNTIQITKFVERYIQNRGDTISNKDFDSLVQKIKNKIRKYIVNREERNSNSKFYFSSSDDDFIIGIAEKVKKYELFPTYYRYLITVDDQKFEKIAAAYIKLLFGESSIVTRRSGDGGIDFLAKGLFSKITSKKLGQLISTKYNIVFRIVGQAKKYDPSKIKIGTKEIREFFGSVKILQYAIEPNYNSAWMGANEILSNIRLADPYLFVFISTSYYSEDAALMAQNLGVYLFDIDDIVFDLIDREIGMHQNEFNTEKFNIWLSK